MDLMEQTLFPAEGPTLTSVGLLSFLLTACVPLSTWLAELIGMYFPPLHDEAKAKQNVLTKPLVLFNLLLWAIAGVQCAFLVSFFYYVTPGHIARAPSLSDMSAVDLLKFTATALVQLVINIHM